MVEKSERGRTPSRAGKLEAESWARIDGGGMNGRDKGSGMMVGNEYDWGGWQYVEEEERGRRPSLDGKRVVESWDRSTFGGRVGRGKGWGKVV